MATMNINLTDEFADFVKSELDNGEYASASEMVRDALRMMRRDRELEAYKLEALRHAVGIGMAQADRGEYSSRSVAEIAASVLAEDDE